MMSTCTETILIFPNILFLKKMMVKQSPAIRQPVSDQSPNTYQKIFPHQRIVGGQGQKCHMVFNLRTGICDGPAPFAKVRHIRESNRALGVYIRSITRSTMYQKVPWGI